MRLNNNAINKNRSTNHVSIDVKKLRINIKLPNKNVPRIGKNIDNFVSNISKVEIGLSLFSFVIKTNPLPRRKNTEKNNPEKVNSLLYFIDLKKRMYYKSKFPDNFL